MRQPAYNRDMKILLSVPHPRLVSVEAVTKQPFGGTERAFAMLGQAFEQLGHEVTVWSDLDSLPDWTCDVHITQQAELMLNTPDALNIWWSHHFAGQPVTMHQIGYARALADGAVCLSECHRDDIARLLPHLEIETIGHGIDEMATSGSSRRLDNSLRLLYASAPFRGLDKALDIFREVRLCNPEAILYVCSSMAMYGKDDGEHQILLDRCQGYGVHYMGALPSEELKRVMSRCHALLYPSTWPESYCMVADEAAAMGCNIITSPLGALPERFVCYNDDSQMVEACLSAASVRVEPLVRPRLWASVASDWQSYINRLLNRQERSQNATAGIA